MKSESRVHSSCLVLALILGVGSISSCKKSACGALSEDTCDYCDEQSVEACRAVVSKGDEDACIDFHDEAGDYCTGLDEQKSSGGAGGSEGTEGSGSCETLQSMCNGCTGSAYTACSAVADAGSESSCESYQSYTCSNWGGDTTSENYCNELDCDNCYDYYDIDGCYDAVYANDTSLCLGYKYDCPQY